MKMTFANASCRWHDPSVGAIALRDLSGIEALRVVMRGEIAAPPMARLLRFALREMEEGRAVIEACRPRIVTTRSVRFQ
jgi:hypothetical protein